MQFLGSVVLVCLISSLEYSSAEWGCDGFDITLISFHSGVRNPTISVTPNPVKMFVNDKCQLFVEGCIQIKKRIEHAKLSFKVLKDGKLNVLEAKNVNLCAVLADTHYKYQCPFEKTGTYCDRMTGPIDLSQYKKYVKDIKGSVTVQAEIVTNNRPSEVNYFTLQLEIRK